ncbi:hypothetical protein [Auraticoccus monumenti]|uniref:Uncharacterized protein n=1 Tax=Auraticoccus monumenti TaxID=675864 RepID=A0A1G6UF56_9ACTN|nr:hypothetical protein [Auraticoccus monumenti]SDD40040.1 hypothetical protein SAMN04489747_0871 [Auraticoccus monumenti]
MTMTGAPEAVAAAERWQHRNICHILGLDPDTTVPGSVRREERWDPTRRPARSIWLTWTDPDGVRWERWRRH